jgi:DNA repair protein RadA/Sms
MGRDHQTEMPIRYFSEVTARKVDWLWYSYIPFGKITVIQGDPGDGKTTFIVNIAALLSKGLPMPGLDSKASTAGAIYQSAEDGVEDTLKPRLMSAGADCAQIAFIDESEYGLTLNDARIEDAINETKARLLVLDPLQAYLGEGNELNCADGVRPMLKQLAAVAERKGCAIVIIGHMNKASGSKSIYRGLGSIDITAVARSVLLVGRIKNDASVRVIAQVKNSLAKEGKPIAFEIHEDFSIQ